MSEPRLGRRERSRQRMLDAAFVLLAERGFEGTTAADVTLAADLAVGTFYNHFADKAALKDEVVAVAAAGHRNLLAWAAAPAADPVVALALAVKASVRRAASLPPWAGFVSRFGLVEPAMVDALGGAAMTANVGQLASADAIAAVAGLVVAFSILAAERRSDGVAESAVAAMAALRAVGVDAQTAAEAAAVPLPG